MRVFVVLSTITLSASIATSAESLHGRFLYVASPGIRNYLEYGGHGVLVFEIDGGHRFVKRIPIGGLDEDDNPINIKGVCASAVTDRMYISTLRTMMCIDLTTDQLLWERTYDGGYLQSSRKYTIL